MQAVVDSLDEVMAVIADMLPGNIYQPGRRNQIAVAYAHIVLQHQRAIAGLIAERLHAAAFSLARPIYEALVKGLWLYHCASDSLVESHARGKELEQLSGLLDDLEAASLPDVVQYSLRQVKSKYWKNLSSLTHVGHSQIRWWMNPEGVAQDYPPKALDQLGNFANFMALVAGYHLAQYGGNTPGMAVLQKLLPSMPSSEA